MLGSARTIRVSSVTSPFLTGTLKSTRTSTLLPRTSRSRTLRLFMIPLPPLTATLPCSPRPSSPVAARNEPGGLFTVSGNKPILPLVALQVLAYVADEVNGAVGVAPLVVVPAQDLDGLAAGHRERRIEDAARGVTDDVAGDYEGFGVFEDVLQFALGGLFEGGVHLIFRNLAREVGDEVGDGAVGDGYAQGHPVHLAPKIREDGADRARRARGGGDDVQGRRPRAPGILVCSIQELLVVGVGVAGGHVRRLHPEVVYEHLGHRHDAVGGTAGVGDDVVLLGIVGLVVDLVDERGIGALRRGADDDLLGAAFQVPRGFVA